MSAILCVVLDTGYSRLKTFKASVFTEFYLLHELRRIHNFLVKKFGKFARLTELYGYTSA